jgi:predicted  nucleic acid-binding Zn-ribbon protein
MKMNPAQITRAIFFIVFAVFMSAGVCGCSREIDTAELGLLVHEDGVYAELIKAQQGIKGQIAGIQKGLSDRKLDMDQKIATLQQTYEADRQSKEQIVNELKGRLKVQKDDFQAGYLKIKNQLEARIKMRADIQKAIREARGVVAKKDKLAITGKEIGEWQARIENLVGRLGPLDTEISDLESAASLKRKKLKYL